jgi:hypothetical protein
MSLTNVPREAPHFASLQTVGQRTKKRRCKLVVAECRCWPIISQRPAELPDAGIHDGQAEGPSLNPSGSAQDSGFGVTAGWRALRGTPESFSAHPFAPRKSGPEVVIETNCGWKSKLAHAMTIEIRA